MGMEHTLDISNISLILAFAFFGGLIFRSLNLPQLTGYMLAGVVIGPSVFDIAGGIEGLKTLSEFAVVLLMFMIGLELDASKFRSVFGTAITIALGQIFLSTAAVFALGSIFSWSLPLVLTLSFMLALSSTAVAVGSLRSLNLLDTKEGNVAVGILIAQDILVVPMLVIVGSLDSGLNIRNAVDLAVTLTGIFGSMFVIFALVSQPKWVTRLEHFFTVGITQPAVAGVGLCFGVAALFGAFGLSSAYGAFAIGLLLGNVGTVGNTYRKAVAPIHDVLVMVFFVSIGLLVDLNFVFEHWIEILVTVTVAIALKIIGTTLILRWYDFSWNTSFQMSGILGHIGEFAFVLSALAAGNALLTEEQYILAITVIAMSLLVSPFVSKVFSKEY
jgi:CPA2 family monovalent cation:H+ antiporter-2